MPKVKTLFVILLVITFSFSLLGCGLVTSRTASTDEVVETGGQVPEWLLLSHRSIASEVNDIDDDRAVIDEEDEEEVDEAVSGLDDNDGATADSSQNGQASSEVAQAAESRQTEGTQHQTSQQQEPAPSGDPVKDIVDRIVPGTREYNEYLQKRKQGETPEEWVRREIKEREGAAEQEGNAGHWFDDAGTGGIENW